MAHIFKRAAAVICTVFALMMVYALLPKDVAAQDRANERPRYAVLIGNWDYQRVPDVKYGEETLRRMERAVQDVLGVQPNRIHVDENITLTGLRVLFQPEGSQPAQLSEFIIDNNADVLVYFVGQSAGPFPGDCPDANDCSIGFIMGTEADPNALSRTGYQLAQFKKDLAALKRSSFPDGRVTLVLDTSFGGEVAEGQLNPNSQALPIGTPKLLRSGNEIAVLRAARGTGLSLYDDERGVRVFTDELVKGLYGHADADNDRNVTVGELENFVTREVRRFAREERGGGDPQWPEFALADDLGRDVVMASLDPSQLPLDPSLRADANKLKVEVEFLLGVGIANGANMREMRGRLSRALQRCDTLGCARVFPELHARLQTEVRELDAQLAFCDNLSSLVPDYLAPTDQGLLDDLFARRSAANCPANAHVEACVASTDPTSVSCVCLGDPSGQGCEMSPAERVCAAEFSAAEQGARDLLSLRPLDRFAADSGHCVQTRDGALETARTSICSAAAREAQAISDPERLGQLIEGLAGCPATIVSGLQQMADDVSCDRDFARAMRPPVDHREVAAFMLSHGACVAELESAEGTMREAIDSAMRRAEQAERGAQSEAADRELKDLRSAYADLLSGPQLRRLDSSIDSLMTTDCAHELWTAEQSGAEALSTFIEEFGHDCVDELGTAERALATAECESAYGRVRTGDAASLERFMRENRSCERELSRARARYGDLVRGCIENARGQERSINRALNAYRSCGRQFSAAPAFQRDQISREIARLEERQQCANAFGRVNTASRSDLNAFFRNYGRNCPAEAAQANNLVAMLPPPLDGTYVGTRGYTDRGRRSPGRHCLGRYNFTAEVRNGSITFYSDNRSWRGSVDASGNITISRSGISPPPNQWTEIRARIDPSTGRASGSLANGYCGSGFFQMSRR